MSCLCVRYNWIWSSVYTATVAIPHCSKNLTGPIERCTVYNFLVQKAPRIQQETPSIPLKIQENRLAAAGSATDAAGGAHSAPKGGAENAGVENAGVEKAGVDSRDGKCRSGNAGVDSRGGKCRSGKSRRKKERKAVRTQNS